VLDRRTNKDERLAAASDLSVSFLLTVLFRLTSSFFLTDETCRAGKQCFGKLGTQDGC